MPANLHALAGLPPEPMCRLMVLAALPAIQREDGHWLLPAKLVSGMRSYASHWPAPVILGLQAGDRHPSADLDNAYWAPDDLPFEVRALPFPELARQGHPLLEGTLVLAMLNHELNGLARQCRRHRGIYVANTELTLRTQWQIASSASPPGLARLKTQAWLLWNHRRALAEISLAHGLQCNGAPTFDAYAQRNPNHLLYFDNRAPEDQLITPQDLQARLQRMRQRGHPHLLFSGRLHKIKGAHHLVPMARLLREAGVDFELSIAGDGPLRPDIEAQIRSCGLQERVRCLGVLRFEDELMPLLRQRIDLFACPHLQGDPSCTYIETLSGGVPIAGYDNEAWRGLWHRCRAGAVSAGNTPADLADAITALVRNTADLEEHAQRARLFASQHLFEHEFAARVEHLRQTVARQGN